MANSPLLGAKLKIERADHHIIDLHARLATFFSTDPNLVVKSIEANGENGVLKVKLTRALPTIIPAIASDAVSNLRSALDLLVFDLATHAGHDAPERTHFPFAGNLQEYESSGTQRKIELLDDRARAVMAELQPYRDGGNQLLWALNRVRNSDLHRKIVAVGVAIASANVSIKIRPGLGLNTIESPQRARFDENLEAVFFRYRGTEIESDYKIALDVAFRDVEIVDGQPVVATLHQFASMTRGIISLFEERVFKAGS